MRIRILTMGMFVLCLSIFFFSAVSSEATTDDQLVINALLDRESGCLPSPYPDTNATAVSNVSCVWRA